MQPFARIPLLTIRYRYFFMGEASLYERGERERNNTEIMQRVFRKLEKCDSNKNKKPVIAIKRRQEWGGGN